MRPSKGASSASYAADRIATIGKRQQQEYNYAQDLSTYQQVEAWRIDQGEMVTSTKSKKHCPGKGDWPFKHNIVESRDEFMQDKWDARIETDMNVDLGAGWTPADLAAITYNIDKGHRGPIADALARNHVIPVDGRTMMRCVEVELGNIKEPANRGHMGG